jgi:hypothetical protein
VKKEVISQSMMMACVTEAWLMDHCDDLVPGFVPPPRAAVVTAGGPRDTDGNSGDTVLTPYAKSVLQLRAAFEDVYCGRFVRVLPPSGEGEGSVVRAPCFVVCWGGGRG